MMRFFGILFIFIFSNVALGASVIKYGRKKILWKTKNTYYFDLDQNGSAELKKKIFDNGFEIEGNLEKIIEMKQSNVWQKFYFKRENKNWILKSSEEISVTDNANHKFHYTKYALNGPHHYFFSDQALESDQKVTGMNKLYGDIIQLTQKMDGGILIDECEMTISQKLKIQQDYQIAVDHMISCLMKQKNSKSREMLRDILDIVYIQKNKLVCQKQGGYLARASSKVDENYPKIEFNPQNVEAKDMSLIFFHELFHLTNILHRSQSVDQVSMCEKCCANQNANACKLCFETDSLENLDSYYKAVLSYANIFDGKYFDYIETLLPIISSGRFIDSIELGNIDYDQSIGILYHQFESLLQDPRNSRGNEQLRYSDIIAELMAKMSCYERDHYLAQDEGQRQSCEVLFLARSLPESYCTGHVDKQACREGMQAETKYYRQVDHRLGRLPSNFLLLSH